MTERFKGRKIPRGVSLRRRKSGVRFRARFTDHNGVRRSKTFEHLDDAAMFAETGRATSNRVRAGLQLPPEQRPTPAPTLAAAAAALLDEPPATWSASHEHDVRIRLETYVLPRLGGKPLDAITRGDVIRLRDAVVRAGRARRTANKVVSALSVVLDRAVDDEIIDANTAKGRGIRLKVQRERPRTLTTSEAQAFIDASDEAWRPLFAAAILTGARFGELTSALWGDLDLERLRWHCCRSKGRRITKSGKDRQVTLPKALLPYMTAIIEQLYDGATPPADHLVFRRTNRHRRRWPESPKRPSPWCPYSCPRTARITAASGAIREAATEADLPFVPTFHHLRHSHASIAMAKGVPATVVRDQLGHSTLEVTDLYAHAQDRGPVVGLDLSPVHGGA